MFKVERWEQNFDIFLEIAWCFLSHSHAHYSYHCESGGPQYRPLIGRWPELACQLPITGQVFCQMSECQMPGCHCGGKCQTKCEEWEPIRAKMLDGISLAVLHPSFHVFVLRAEGI